MSIFDYEDIAPPTIRRRKRVPSPNGGTAGFISTWDRGLCYLSLREKREHFFRKHAGYAISTDILDDLDRQGIQTVFIGETDTGVCYEYDTAAFREGRDFQYEDYDEQKLAPLVTARREWPHGSIAIQ